MLGGDFNCVLDTHRDRLGRRHRGKGSCESKSLQRLVDELNLHDAHDTVRAEQENLRPDPADSFTHWRRGSVSRIDRFYTTAELVHLVQWLDTTNPAR